MASSDRPTPQDLLAAEVEAAVLEAWPIANVRRIADENALAITLEGDFRMMYLGNLFAETRDLTPDERRRQIERHVRLIVRPEREPEGWEDVRAHLVPLLRAELALPTFPDGATTVAPTYLARPFVPELLEYVGIDSDDGIAYVTTRMVADWGRSPEDIFARATSNAVDFFADDVIEAYDPEYPVPLWYVARDDSYESSRLLLPGWLASFEGRVKGRPLAIVPHRSLLIVGGDGDEGCIQRLAGIAEREHQASPRRISPAVYTVDGQGRVVPCDVPARASRQEAC